MAWFIARRLAQSVLVLLIVVTVVFFLGRVVGDPSSNFISENATQADVDAIKKSLGLDRPLIYQYGLYMGDLLQGDLGRSIVLRSFTVTEQLRPALINSVKLAAFAMAIAVITGIPLGMISAVKRGTPIDFAARLTALIGQVVPAWWLGIVMILLFSIRWNLLPPAGMGGITHYIMPGLVMGLFVMAGMARLTRSSMLEILDSEYIKLARAKGLPHRMILFKHALRNALVPLVTFGGLYFATLITSAVVIEVVFSWPGLGRLMVDSLSRNDFPVLQGAILLGAGIVVSFNLIVDVLYAYIDPRIRYA